MKTKNEILNDFTQMNCCQTTLNAYAKAFDLDMSSLLKITAGFGGGLNTGEVCGAVSGIVMALGYKHASSDLTDEVSMLKTKEMTKKFIDEFQAVNGAIRCEDLLGHNPSTEKGMKAINEEGLKARVCPKAVYSAVEISKKYMT